MRGETRFWFDCSKEWGLRLSRSDQAPGGAGSPSLGPPDSRNVVVIPGLRDSNTLPREVTQR